MKEFFFEPKRLYYRMNEFQPLRQTLVFVHGLSGSSSAWVLYEKEFESTYNILFFDLRGHGKSWKPQSYEEYQVDDFADDLYEITEYLNILKFTLVGHSLGCFVVLAFLKKHQEKVSRVIFLAPNFSVKKMLSAKIINPLLSIVVPLLKYLPFSGRAGEHIDYSNYPNSGDWSIPRMIADIGNTSLRVYLYATKQTYDFDAENFLDKIYIPTLIIHGEKDTIFPFRYGIFMAERIHDSKIILLGDANHILVLNKSKEVIKEIKNFVVS